MPAVCAQSIAVVPSCARGERVRRMRRENHKVNQRLKKILFFKSYYGVTTSLRTHMFRSMRECAVCAQNPQVMPTHPSREVVWLANPPNKVFAIYLGTGRIQISPLDIPRSRATDITIIAITTLSPTCPFTSSPAPCVSSRYAMCSCCLCAAHINAV